MHASAAESRTRLGLDRLPLVYLHDPEQMSYENGLARGEAVEALQELQADKVISHLGGRRSDHLMRRYMATRIFEVVMTHNRFTVRDRSAQPLLDDCVAAGVAVVNGARSGVACLGRDRMSPTATSTRL